MEVEREEERCNVPERAKISDSFPASPNQSAALSTSFCGGRSAIPEAVITV